MENRRPTISRLRLKTFILSTLLRLRSDPVRFASTLRIPFNMPGYQPAGLRWAACQSIALAQMRSVPAIMSEISHGFWITNTEVTVSAYERFTRVTGHPSPPKTKTNPKWKLSEHPVTEVTWQDAEDYCKWTVGRLPTEAEWEYAARAGKPDQVYTWGNEFDPNLCNSMKSGKQRGDFTETVPVRRFDTPNGWNLFGMIGNAREWVSDAYDPTAYAKAGTASDPHMSEPGRDRVLRGGSFGDGEKQLHISARDHLEPHKHDNQTGFRCALLELR